MRVALRMCAATAGARLLCTHVRIADCRGPAGWEGQPISPGAEESGDRSGLVAGNLGIWTRRLWAPALGGLLALSLGLLLVRTRQWSMFDEYTHFDYVVKIAQDLEAPPANDTLGDTGLQTAACERAPGFEALFGLCGQDIDPAVAPYAGLSTATNYLPTYYVPTGLLTRFMRPVVEALNPGHSQTAYWLMSARVVGALYLGLLAALLVAVGRRLGANNVAAVSAALLVVSSPMVLMQFSTVNNDQFAVLLSALAVLFWLALENRSRWIRLSLSYGTALLAITAKETALVAVLAIVLLHIFEGSRRDARWWGFPQPLLLGAVVMGASSVAQRGLARPQWSISWEQPAGGVHRIGSRRSAVLRGGGSGAAQLPELTLGALRVNVRDLVQLPVAHPDQCSLRRGRVSRTGAGAGPESEP